MWTNILWFPRSCKCHGGRGYCHLVFLCCQNASFHGSNTWNLGVSNFLPTHVWKRASAVTCGDFSIWLVAICSSICISSQIEFGNIQGRVHPTPTMSPLLYVFFVYPMFSTRQKSINPPNSFKKPVQYNNLQTLKCSKSTTKQPAS